MKLKPVLLFYATIFVMAGYSQSATPEKSDSLAHFNLMLSPEQMQKDLAVLRKIREEANSGLYIYRSKAQTDSIYKWAFSEIQLAKPITEFFKIILRLTDFEGSVHNYSEPGLELLNYIKNQHTFFPYKIAYIEGNMVFDGIHDSIPPGSRVVRINGTGDSQLMKSFHKYFTADGFTTTSKRSSSVENAFDWRYVVEYGITDKYVVEFIPPGTNKIRTATLPAVSFEKQKENYAKRFSAPVTERINFRTQAPYSFTMIRPGVALLNLRWFGFAGGKEDPAFQPYVQFLDSVFTVLADQKITNLIIDVRNNPGGSDPLFEQPVMYLSDKTFRENLETRVIFDPATIPQREYFWGVTTAERMDSVSMALGMEFLRSYFDEFKNGISRQKAALNPVYFPKEPAYRGKLYLLINENVASAASHFASLVKAYARNVTIIGVETEGGYYVHNGHIATVYELPNSGIKTKFSIVYVVQDAPVLKDQPPGRGIIPHYEVWPKLDDFLNHRDTQLEFALQIILH